jgi:hypothetical protein
MNEKKKKERKKEIDLIDASLRDSQGVFFGTQYGPAATI